jgi:hypothetical protein
MGNTCAPVADSCQCMAKIYNGGKAISLTSGAGETGQPPVKE